MHRRVCISGIISTSTCIQWLSDSDGEEILDWRRLGADVTWLITIRVVGAFLDGNSALMLVRARLRHVAGTQWATRSI